MLGMNQKTPLWRGVQRPQLGFTLSLRLTAEQLLIFDSAAQCQPPRNHTGACWLLLLVFTGVQHLRSFVVLAVTYCKFGPLATCHQNMK